MATGLPGMKAICAFCNRSEATILKWIREKDFPAVKITGSWESDQELIKAWRIKQIKGRKKGRSSAKSSKFP